MPDTDSVTRYEGAWLRSQADWYPDPDRFTVHGPPDPGHGDESEAPPPLMMDAPVLQSGGEIVSDILWENHEHLPPSVLIDQEPVEGQGTPEESGHGYGGSFRIYDDAAELGAHRGRDRGAAKKKTSDSPTYRFFNEVFYGFFTKGFEPPPITMTPTNPVFIRGINGHPANNGDGERPTSWSISEDVTTVGSGAWRRGDYEGSAVERDFSPPNRRHGEPKIVEVDHPTIIGDAPPPDKSDTYASPFSSLQKFMPKRRRPEIGGIRRDPGPWDEEVIAKASDLPYNLVQSADGMTVF